MKTAESLKTMTDSEFQIWSDLIRERTGMELPVQRKSFLVTTLDIRIKELGCDTYKSYYNVLSAGISGEIEWNELIGRLTVHETRFFRHQSSLDVVRQYAKDKPAGSDRVVRLNIWSVGCSTGEEPYTIAMILDHVMCKRTERTLFSIVATDISIPSIKAAQKGLYKKAQVEKNVEAHIRERYFDQQDNGDYLIKKRLKNRICFSPVNIMKYTDELIGKVDIVYCQNLLIYFDKETRLKIVNSMVEQLNPGGFMVLGTGEILGWKHPEMELLSIPNTLVYKRKRKL